MNGAIRMVIGDYRIRTAPDRVQLELAARRFLLRYPGREKHSSCSLSVWIQIRQLTCRRSTTSSA
jgi:hypothetical protein